MNIKYWISRYRVFRKGYIRAASQGLVTKGQWLLHACITYVLPYLIYPEINQYRLLSETIRQKDRYITYLQSCNPQNANESQQAREHRNILRWINRKFALQVILYPIAIAGFMFRKLKRIVLLRVQPLTAIQESPAAGSPTGTNLLGTCAGCFSLVSENPGNRLPAGLVFFRYRISGNERDRPVLHLDVGAGFSDELSIPLPYSGGALKECLIEMPPYIRSLRLCTGLHETTVESGDLVLVETNLFLAARKHASLHNLRFIRSLYEIFIREYPWTRRPPGFNQSYASWINHFDVLSPADIRAINSHITSLKAPFPITILIRCGEGAADLLKRTIDSIQQQLYTNWNLLLFAESGVSASTLAMISGYDRKDGRIRLVSGTNRFNPDTILKFIINDSSCIAFLEEGDVLPQHALYMIAEHFLESPGAGLIYADHDYMDASGRRLNPYFKPDWNHDLFLSCNYLTGIVAIPTRLLQEVYDSNDPVELPDPRSFVYEIVSHIPETAIHHLPFVLCHRKMADNLPQDVVEATGNKLLKAMTAHLNRTTPGACAELVDPARRIFRVSRRQSGNEFPVSLIVPTRNYYGLLSNCITGILEHTDYRNLEIIIVDNDSDDVITLEYLDTLRSNDRVSVIKYPGEFNYSAINNFAVEHCRHEYIGLINNDISVINTGWLSEMMGHLIRDEVGIVGAKLLYGNDTIQHAGVIIGLGGVAGHAFRHFPCNSPGVNDRLLLTQQLSCVTGACLLTKKSIYKSVGGLDQVNLKIAFNDVDYCLKVMDLGYKIIWTPYAELYHLESASRGFDLNDTNIERWQSEYDYMKNKWNFKLQDDPAYNPNLTIGTEDFTLSNRPRINKPWASFNE